MARTGTANAASQYYQGCRRGRAESSVASDRCGRTKTTVVTIMNKPDQTPDFSAALLSTSPSPYQTFSALFSTFPKSIFSPCILKLRPFFWLQPRSGTRRCGASARVRRDKWPMASEPPSITKHYASARARLLSLGFVFPIPNFRSANWLAFPAERHSSTVSSFICLHQVANLCLQ